LKQHLNRIHEKRNTALERFLEDMDRQESVIFNIQLAVQSCIDIAAHIIGEEGLGVPGSTSEMFYLLEESGYLDRDLAEKMVKAVGFRNLIVHQYSKVEMKRVFEIAQKDIQDLREYLVAILRKLGLPG
jgi:uncharacterized protein YutE (UPF0331/DUF86 family)